ncbi:MAG: MerR family DNA-binding protein [Marinobacter sp.]|nr:MerR family DNA-binding protein [Marinobacter sp.]
MTTHLLIGDVARKSGCTPETIRHYERIGLLAKPWRGDNGYRYYTAAAVQQLGFIRRCRALGLELDAIRELIALAGQPEERCESVNELARRHVADLRQRIADLQALADELDASVHRCPGNTIAHCGILESLTPALSDSTPAN